MLRQSKSSKWRWLEDNGILVGCGVAGVLLVAFQAPQMWSNFQDRQLSGQIARQTLIDAAIAERRYSLGCNTEFLILGKPVIVAGEIPVDLRGVPLPRGTLLCDGNGTTAVVGQDNRATDPRNSARIKNTFIQQGLGVRDGNQVR